MKLPFFLLSLFILLISGCQPTGIEHSTIKKKSVFVEANGELASSDTAIISPPQVRHQWQYKITFIMPEGSQVKNGQPLIKFDASQLVQKLAIKQSELNTSKKALENIYLTTKAEKEQQKLKLAESKMLQGKAKRKWQQSKGLQSTLEIKKLSLQYKIANNEVLRLERTLEKSLKATEVKIAIEESKVERIQSEVTQFQTGISRMTIAAPKAGIVMYKSDGGGNKISSGDTVWFGRQLIELPSLENMVVKAQILEADAGKVKVGQPVEIVLDAIPERIFKGKISQLGKVFRRKSRDQANIIFDADITLDNSDTELMRPGMATRIKILLNDV